MLLLLDCPSCKLSEDVKIAWNEEISNKAKYSNKLKAFVSVPTNCPKCGKVMLIDVEN